MTTTVNPPVPIVVRAGTNVRTGTVKLRRGNTLLQDVPAALDLITGRSRFLALPRTIAGEPAAVCLCGGLLVYVNAFNEDVEVRHCDACLACWETKLGGKACEERHVTCSQPEIRECSHRCGAPVALADRCAWDGIEASCCNCCWDLHDRPDIDGARLTLR